MNDLTISNIERQNVLNNRYALQTIRENLDVDGLHFHDQLLFTTKMVAEFYEVDERTIKRYIQEYGDELSENGYFLSQGNSLKELRLQFARDINVPNKARKIGIFPFRAFLNIGMLLTESEKAKQLRTRILDIVISTINIRAGGGTKYIKSVTPDKFDKLIIGSSIDFDTILKANRDVLKRLKHSWSRLCC